MIPRNITQEHVFQAIDIVNDSGASFFMEHKVFGGPEFIIVGGKGSHIDYEEPRFIEDDLDTLVELGMLKLDYTGKGDRRYHITREAVSFLGLAENK